MKLKHCPHVMRGERRPAALLSFTTLPSWPHDRVDDVDGLCVVCAARVVALLMRLEAGDEIDPS